VAIVVTLIFILQAAITVCVCTNISYDPARLWRAPAFWAEKFGCAMATPRSVAMIYVLG
jgi:hypothetical protein